MRTTLFWVIMQGVAVITIFKGLEDGLNRLFQNIGKELPSLTIIA
jgi:Flp pilus assembly pilin Flp